MIASAASQILLTTPLLASPVLTGSLSAFTTEKDQTAWSSAYENIKGVRAAMLYTGAPFVQRELAAEVSWRHLARMLPDASISMRKLGGHSVKAALTHTWVRDTRDDPFRATRGTYLKAVQELAAWAATPALSRSKAKRRRRGG